MQHEHKCPWKEYPLILDTQYVAHHENCRGLQEYTYNILALLVVVIIVKLFRVGCLFYYYGFNYLLNCYYCNSNAVSTIPMGKVPQTLWFLKNIYDTLVKCSWCIGIEYLRVWIGGTRISISSCECGTLRNCRNGAWGVRWRRGESHSWITLLQGRDGEYVGAIVWSRGTIARYSREPAN